MSLFSLTHVSILPNKAKYLPYNNITALLCQTLCRAVLEGRGLSAKQRRASAAGGRLFDGFNLFHPGCRNTTDDTMDLQPAATT